MPERDKDEGSPHLTPTNIGLTRAFEISRSRTTKEESDIERIRRLARLTTSAQHYDQPEAKDGLELLPTPTPEMEEGPNEDGKRTPVDAGSPSTTSRQKGIPQFSLKAVDAVCKIGTTQMDHYVGRNSGGPRWTRQSRPGSTELYRQPGQHRPRSTTQLSRTGPTRTREATERPYQRT